jgi:4-nitrophenyl phosphatase
MGITVEEEEVFTSALATALYLQQNGEAGKSAYLIGEEGLHAAMHDVGMRVVDDGPEWVIVGLDRDLTYERLTVAALALEQGARFLATNGDTSLPTERGLVPGAGAILAALTATTGQQPIVIGKPQPLMLQLAMDAVGGSVENTVMLGDRLNTDIGAAQALGIPSILVLTGVSTRADLAHSQIQPTLVVDNLNELMRLWLHQH